MRRAAIFLFLLAGSAWAGGINDMVLEQVRTMPSGGGYATTLNAHRGLAEAVRPGDEVVIRPESAMPGYCSGATYLVFLKTLAALQRKGVLTLSEDVWKVLVPRLRPDGSDTLPDGESVWGRWNANGPGTARLFCELGLGRNFTSFDEARPGDFLKIFWTDAVGRKERGHSVIYLGRETLDGVEHVRFWSSNRPDGFGVKSVPRETVVHAIFSRLEHPEKIAAAPSLPVRDAYLASLLDTESSFAEAKRKTKTR
jgi:hypothetical protein